jgi:hypothetical protein
MLFKQYYKWNFESYIEILYFSSKIRTPGENN